MNKILIILFAFIISCSEREISGKTENQSQLSISRKNFDIIISSWYLNQYIAIEELERVTELKAQTGSKLISKPNELLDKQKEIVQKYTASNGLDSNLEAWSNAQNSSFEELSLSLDFKILPPPEMLNFAEKGIYLIDKQSELIADANKRVTQE